MAKAYYLPNGDEERATWLNNFAVKLSHYAMKYSVTSEEMMDAQSSALYFDALIKGKNQFSNFQNAYTAYKNAMRNGLKAGATLQPLVQPMLTLPPPVPPGIFTRMAAIVNRIKSHINYSVADGLDLGIEGAEKTVETSSTKPTANLRLSDGGHPELLWVKYNFDGIEVHKQVDGGEMQFLAIDMQPHFIDLSELPPPGKSAVWTYRIIYLLKDKRVGQWSDVVRITVTG
ncbi:MAG: hypothetical protein IPJ74_15370 [Saprospiraceae bacterium]|nr:hypothetical protein [Saprospiraceae bacterium]